MHQMLLAVLFASAVQAQPRGDDPLEFFREVYPDATSALAFSPDGQLVASGGVDETLRLWNPATGKETFKTAAHKKGVRAVAFSPDGKWLLSAGQDKRIRIWDLAGKEIASLEGHDGAVTCLLFSPDGKELISGSDDKTVRFWNLAERKEVRKFTAHASGVQSLSLTSDNLLVTTGEKTEVFGSITSTGPDKPRLWNLATFKEVRAYDIEAGLAVVSFDRRFLATAGLETSVKPGVFQQKKVSALRDAATGKILIDFKGQVGAMAFSPDGKILAAWGMGAKLRLIETITGQEIHAVPDWTVGVVAFSSDGKRLASGELGKARFPGGKPEAVPRVRFLDIPPQPEKWAKLAKDADPADLWMKLASKDSAAAYEALWTLTAVPEKAVPLFKEHLKLPRAGPDPAQFRKLIADLDKGDFAVRQEATRELKKLGHGAEFHLRQALDSGSLGLEARRRVQDVLAALELPFPCQGDALRDARSLQALDLMGTPESLALIRTLADGPPTSLLAQDAQRILQRRKK